MTEALLQEIETRLSKGWVIRPERIRELVAAVRASRDHPAHVVQAGAIVGDYLGAQYPGGVVWIPAAVAAKAEAA